MPSSYSWVGFPPEPRKQTGPSWLEVCTLLDSPQYNQDRLRRLVGARVDVEGLLELWRGLRSDARAVGLSDRQFSEALGPGELLEVIPHRARQRNIPLDPQRFDHLQDLWWSIVAGKSETPTAAFPNRAAWLQSTMDRHKLKPYRIHKAGGPDYKTIRRILKGQNVNDEPLEKLRHALAFITNTAAEKVAIPND